VNTNPIFCKKIRVSKTATRKCDRVFQVRAIRVRVRVIRVRDSGIGFYAHRELDPPTGTKGGYISPPRPPALLLLPHLAICDAREELPRMNVAASQILGPPAAAPPPPAPPPNPRRPPATEPAPASRHRTTAGHRHRAGLPPPRPAGLPPPRRHRPPRPLGERPRPPAAAPFFNLLFVRFG
jgi:hypothetical protein